MAQQYRSDANGGSEWFSTRNVISFGAGALLTSGSDAHRAALRGSGDRLAAEHGGH